MFCFVLFCSEEPRRSKFEILRPWCRAGLAKAPVILSPCNIRRWSHQKLAICFCYFFLSHTYFGYHRTELGFHELVHQKRYEIPAKNLSKRYTLFNPGNIYITPQLEGVDTRGWNNRFEKTVSNSRLEKSGLYNRLKQQGKTTCWNSRLTQQVNAKDWSNRTIQQVKQQVEASGWSSRVKQ